MSKGAWLGVVIVLVGGGLWWGLSNHSNSPSSSSSTSAQGRAVFMVTDPGTASVQGATSIMVTVDKVEAHSASGSWETVSTATKQYDLLQLKQSGAAMLLADVKLAPGTYEQVRLDISDVEVTVAGKVYQAKLPSNTLKIVGTFTVKAGETSTISLDFAADKSLYVTGNGTYILAPVVRLTTKDSATVAVGDDEKVSVTGGRIETDETVGTDENGDTRANFELNGNLEVDANGGVHVVGSASLTPSTSPRASETPKASASVTPNPKVTISISNFLFNPAVVTVKKGTRVTWTNNDSMAHTVTSDSGTLLNSASIAPGQSFSFTFSSVGTVAYHCSIHPSMTGTVIVAN